MRNNVGDAFKSVSMRSVSRRVFDMFVAVDQIMVLLEFAGPDQIWTPRCVVFFFPTTTISFRKPTNHGFMFKDLYLGAVWQEHKNCNPFYAESVANSHIHSCCPKKLLRVLPAIQ